MGAGAADLETGIGSKAPCRTGSPCCSLDAKGRYQKFGFGFSNQPKFSQLVIQKKKVITWSAGADTGAVSRPVETSRVFP